MRSTLLLPANPRSLLFLLIVSFFGTSSGRSAPPVPVAEASPVPTAIAEVTPVSQGLPEITVEGSQRLPQPTVSDSGTEIAVAIPLNGTAQSKLLAQPVATYVPATPSPTASTLPGDSRVNPAAYGFVPSRNLASPPAPAIVNSPASSPRPVETETVAPERKPDRPHNRAQTNVARLSAGGSSIRSRKLETPPKTPDHAAQPPSGDRPELVMAQNPAPPKSESLPKSEASAASSEPAAESRFPDLARILPVSGSARPHTIEPTTKVPDRVPEPPRDQPMMVVTEAPAKPEAKQPAKPGTPAIIPSPKSELAARGQQNVARSLTASDSGRARQPAATANPPERTSELLAGFLNSRGAAAAAPSDSEKPRKNAHPEPASDPASDTGRAPAIPNRIHPVSGFARSRSADSPPPPPADAPSPEPAPELKSKEPGLGTRLVSMLQRTPDSPEQVGSQEAKKPEPAANPPSSVEIPPPVKRSSSPNSGPVPSRTGTPPQGTLVIHFASHSREVQALADRDELARVGVFSRIVPTRGSFGVEYRVVSAPFVTETEARRCLTQVKKRSQGFRDATIGELFPERWQQDR